MKLDNQQLLEKFYQEHSNKYPDVDFERIKEVCFGPWRFLKQEMESGELPSVRFKYFGSFQVYKGRAENMLYNLKVKFDNEKITEDYYMKYKVMIENYLKKLNEKDT